MTPPPSLYVVFSAAADDDRREPIAAFTSRVAAEDWARTMARDFRRGYVVAAYTFGSEGSGTEYQQTIQTFEPPGPAASVNGQLPLLQPGSRHADKTKPGPAATRRGRREYLRRDGLGEREIE